MCTVCACVDRAKRTEGEGRRKASRRQQLRKAFVEKSKPMTTTEKSLWQSNVLFCFERIETKPTPKLGGPFGPCHATRLLALCGCCLCGCGLPCSVRPGHFFFLTGHLRLCLANSHSATRDSTKSTSATNVATIAHSVSSDRAACVAERSQKIKQADGAVVSLSLPCLLLWPDCSYSLC